MLGFRVLRFLGSTRQLQIKDQAASSGEAVASPCAGAPCAGAHVASMGKAMATKGHLGSPLPAATEVT